MKCILQIAGTLYLAGFVLLQVFHTGLTNDTEMLLHNTAHMLYEGGLYRHWITVNPPVIYFLYALPVLCSIHFGLPSSIPLHGFTATLCILSLAVSYCCLRAHQLNQSQSRIWIAAATIALLIAPVMSGTFSDREHYLFIFAMPWILQMLLRLPAYPATIISAMIGLCIKPYNLVLLPAFILFGGPEKWSLRQRLLSPSSIIGAIAVGLYLLLLIIIFPAYLSVIMPIALKSYSLIAYPFSTRAKEAGIYFILSLIPISLVRPVPLRTSFLAFSAATALIYFLNAGWAYTRYVPLVPLVLLSPALWLSGAAAQGIKVHARKILSLLLSAFVIFCSTYQLSEDVSCTTNTGQACNYNKISPEIKQALQKVAGDNFILVSINLWSAVISALHGAPHSIGNFDDGPWPLAWVGQHRGNAEATYIWQAIFVKPFTDALLHYPSATLIVDESPGQRANLFKLLEEDPTVQQALANYTGSTIIDRCENAESLECRFSAWRGTGAIPH